MAFDEQKISGRKSTYKEIEFDLFKEQINKKDDCSLQKQGMAKVCYNFCTGSGALTNGYGFEALSCKHENEEGEKVIPIDSNPLGAICHRWYNRMTSTNQYYIVYLGEDQKMHWRNVYNPLTDTTLYLQTEFTAMPNVLSYRRDNEDMLVMSSSEGTFYISDSTYFSKKLPLFKSLAVAFGRLFAIRCDEKCEVVYSDDLDFLGWDMEAVSKITLGDAERGLPTKLVLLNDNLYIFREYGITKLVHMSSSEQYVISQVYLCDCKIYANTIAYTQGQIIFLAQDGLYRFNGSSVTKIKLECEDLFRNKDNSLASACAYAGKYYLACNVDFEEPSSSNNSLIVYDFESDHVDITYGVDISMLSLFKSPYKDAVIACFRDENKDKIGQIAINGAIFDKAAAKVWQSNEINLDNKNVCRAIEFTIKSLSNCEVVISSDVEEKTYQIEGKDKIQNIRVNVLGKVFSVKISTSERQNVLISNAKIKFRVLK